MSNMNTENCNVKNRIWCFKK